MSAVADVVVPGGTVVRVELSRSATSHTLYEVVADVDGERVDLVFKDLRAAALVPAARGRRPSLVDDPGREVAVYTELLPNAEPGTARCWASGEEWLLLERVPGVELWQVGELETWADAARWLARFHRTMAAVAARPPRLLVHDAAFYRAWARRAAASHDDPRLSWVLDRYERTVVPALAELPRTVVHGDCSASNVLVDGSRVCPIDWESAAVGPGAADVAALVSGWPDDERRRIALAYHEVAGGDPTAFLRDVDTCSVQLCVQWLGWSPGWVPPPEHRHDWVATAVDLLERLGE